MRGYKGDLYEGGLRVPSIVEWPEVVTPNSSFVSNLPMTHTDYMPTILNIFNRKLPDNRPLDGISLLPYIYPAKRRFLTTLRQDRLMLTKITSKNSAKQRIRVVIAFRYKLIAYEVDGKDVLELYNLQRDVGETVNLATPDHLQKLEWAREAVDQANVWLDSIFRSRNGSDYT